MANYYLQFSEVLADLTIEQIEWCKGALTVPEDEEVRQVWEASLDMDDYDTDDLEIWPDFQWKVEADGGQQRLWFYGEESGNIDNAAKFVHEFLKRWRSDRYFLINYASYCSKLRLSEFHGGAVIITDKVIIWPNTLVDKAIEGLDLTPLPKPVDPTLPGKVEDARLVRRKETI